MHVSTCFPDLLLFKGSFIFCSEIFHQKGFRGVRSNDFSIFTIFSDNTCFILWYFEHRFITINFIERSINICIILGCGTFLLSRMVHILPPPLEYYLRSTSLYFHQHLQKYTVRSYSDSMSINLIHHIDHRIDHNYIKNCTRSNIDRLHVVLTSLGGWRVTARLWFVFVVWFFIFFEVIFEFFFYVLILVFQKKN